MTGSEFYQKFYLHKLEPGETITRFNCADEDLNDFIKNEAKAYQSALLSVTYLLTLRSNKEVIAYFSLANDKISIADFENKTEFNRFRKHKFVNEKRIRSYPAIKIGRLAVSEIAQNQSIGRYLLDYIKQRYVQEPDAGCRFITVDAYVNAIPFYIKNDFIFLNSDDEDKNTRLMYYDLASQI